MRSKKPTPARPLAPAVEAAVRRMISGAAGGGDRPLPTTREIARQCGTSNATVQRVLSRLAAQGVLWRKENGRYYAGAARFLLEKPKPIGCLLRELAAWTTSYRAIMAGLSRELGLHRRSLVIAHNETLVHHDRKEQAPRIGRPAQQRKALREFLRLHEGRLSGYIVDHLWSDAILQERENDLANAVVVWRPTTLPSLSSVSFDYALAAALTLGHVATRGYDTLWIAQPFKGDPAIDAMVEQLHRIGGSMGMAGPHRVVAADAPEKRRHIAAQLSRQRARVAIFCPEDNTCALLFRSLVEAGIEVPKKAGLISGMGTSAVQQEDITSVTLPFDLLGQEAAKIVVFNQPKHLTLPVGFRAGRTS